jgi:2-oxo-4-hydroxy-4-carboxy-5-ureidoimidazoline decarboxylase
VDVIEAFNALPTARLDRELAACCAAPEWIARVRGGRPYRSRTDLDDAADAAARALSWAEVAKGLAAHPRIGERAAGDSREAAWSRREQSSAARTADEATRAALVRANRDYEERFGHVFLIRAAGRGPAELLAELTRRTGNDEAAERAETTAQLAEITRLRVERLVSG